MWLSLFILLSVSILGLLLWLRLRDRRYLSRPTRETLGDDLKGEVEGEIKTFYDRKKRFTQTLERAFKKRNPKSEIRNPKQ